MMPPIFYQEESEMEESLSDPPSVEPTLEPVPPSETHIEEMTLVPDSDALSEPSVTTREDSMGHLDPKRHSEIP